jgi:CRP/FNR family transcriptional regulator, anaerobic regulatory protein
MTMQARLTTPEPTIPAHLRESPQVREYPLGKTTRSSIPLKCISQTGSIQCKNCSLKKLCLAKSVSDEGLAALTNITHHPRPVQKGEHFFRQDDEFEALYIVHSGAVKTYHLDQNGDEQITGFYLPGELLGIDGVVSGQHRLSAQALNTTTVCLIPYKRLEKVVHEHQDLQHRMMQMLCEEIQNKQQPLLLLRNKPAENLLATFLIDISNRFSARGLSAVEFELPMARCDIASHLGLAGETMSRLFTRFQKMNLISAKGRTICLKNIDQLQAMSVRLN